MLLYQHLSFCIPKYYENTNLSTWSYYSYYMKIYHNNHNQYGGSFPHNNLGNSTISILKHPVWLDSSDFTVI